MKSIRLFYSQVLWLAGFFCLMYGPNIAAATCEVYTELNAEICNGQSFQVGINSYNQTGTYVDTIQTLASCDSIITTRLIVHPVSETTLNKVICSGQSLSIGGQVFNTPGHYTLTLSSSTHCDSIIHLNLSLGDPAPVTIDTTICQGQQVQIGNQVFSQTGNYTVKLTASGGCDSVVMLNLLVAPIPETSLQVTICEGTLFNVGSQVFTQSGTYQVTLSSWRGCDSIVHLKLNVTPKQYVTLSQDICQGESFNVGTHSYFNSGVYLDTLLSSTFCDSIVTTHLTVHPKSTHHVEQTICYGNSVTVGNHTYTQPGVYTDTLSSAWGCDSIVILNLQVQSQILHLQSVSICSGESYTIGSHTYFSSGTYLDTLASAGGCDSIVTTVLQVKPVFQQTFEVDLCEGDSILLGSQIIQSGGTYSQVFNSQYGCDSTVQLHVVLLPISKTIIARNACQGESIQVNGVTFYSDTTFSNKYQNVHGCDSLVIYQLTFSPTYHLVKYQNICSGDLFLNNLIQNDTTIILSLQTANGCDSITTYQIHAVQKTWTRVSETVCYGTLIGGLTLVRDTILQENLQGHLGCDSIVIDTIRVLPDFQVTVSHDTMINPGEPVTLFASGGSSYEWSTGETTPVIVVQPHISTTYLVKIISSTGCIKEKEIEVTMNSCQLKSASYFTPNQDGTHDTWHIRGLDCLRAFHLQVFNRWGEVIFSTESPTGKWDGRYKNTPVPDGVYFYLLLGESYQNEPIKMSGYVHLKK